MITLVHGSLLEAPERVIAHGCNAQGRMGAGVARAIRERWPRCYQEYHQHWEQMGLSTGEVVWYFERPFSLQSKIIANCITQRDTGTDRMRVEYPAVHECMERVMRSALRLGEDCIAVPQIGCGLAGGDWAVVSGILSQLSLQEGCDVRVYIPDEQQLRRAQT